MVLDLLGRHDDAPALLFAVQHDEEGEPLVAAPALQLPELTTETPGRGGRRADTASSADPRAAFILEYGRRRADVDTRVPFVGGCGMP